MIVQVLDEGPEPTPGSTGINLPHLRPAGRATQLVVNGQPFLVLGGELRNSSSSSLEYMRPIWQRLVDLNMNTVLAAVSWELVEPQEGVSDFSLVDGLIADARQHNLRLILLWFGSWKNGMSSYVPAWVKRDYGRFPLARRSDGKSAPVLSTLAEANWQADSRAFAALMSHIREVDSSDQTVIMVQVENEVGLLGDSRDRSDAANSTFAGPVPDELLQYLQQHSSNLLPHLLGRWEQGGRRTSGNWPEVFGEGMETDEIFMAWHYARYIERVAAAGKAEYSIPLFVNAWLNNTVAFPGFPAGGKNPGDYPSGGPLPHLLDLWRAAAPHLDFLAPDIYAPDFDFWCESYNQPGNPLFIPETRADPDGMANLYQAFATFNAIGTSPFGVDSLEGDWATALHANYGILRQLAPLILAHRGSDAMIGFRLDTQQSRIVIPLGGYELEIMNEMQVMYEWLGRVPDAPIKPAYGLIIATGPGTYVGAGFGFRVAFRSIAPATAQVGIEAVEEGEYRDGEWIAGRRLNGDETWSGGSWCFPAGDQPAFGPMPPTRLGSPISCCTVYSYE
jgi:beta-galactosidase GanA